MTPLTSMWTQPRRTVRELISSNPQYGVLSLAMLTGVHHTLDRTTGRSAGDRLPFIGILLAAALLGPVLGIAKIYFGAWLLRWTGRWIRGEATSELLRTALAWGSVPYLLSLALWLPLLLVVGPEMFTTETPRIDSGGLAAWTFFSIAALQVALGMWSVVLVLKGIGEVQGFSAWKALANVLLAGLVLLVPVFVVVGVAMAFRP